MKSLSFSLMMLASLGIFSGCSSQSTEQSSSAQENIQEKLTSRIGQATKQDLVQQFGTPDWCKQASHGEESCRFYKRLGRQWSGDKANRVARETFDEVFADFDTDGRLKTVKVNSQR